MIGILAEITVLSTHSRRARAVVRSKTHKELVLSRVVSAL